MKVRVEIRLKDGVLDPQGKAVELGLHGLGFRAVQNVRVGKLIEFAMEGADAERTQADVAAMCEQLLANTVIEAYRIHVESSRSSEHRERDGGGSSGFATGGGDVSPCNR